MINYKQKLKGLRALVFDMDGVLTTGSFQIGPEGQPIRNLNSKDGYALQLAVKKELIVALISGGRCTGVKKALRRLGLTDIYMDAGHKQEAWEDLLATYQYLDLKPEEMLYMGDDIPDYPLIKAAGVGCAPHNGAAEVRAIADYVSPQRGGEGCVRDVVEQTLKVKGLWMQNTDFKW